jgi:hypothetical protein
MIGKDLLAMAKPIFQRLPNFGYFVDQFNITRSDSPIMNGADTLA